MKNSKEERQVRETDIDSRHFAPVREAQAKVETATNRLFEVQARIKDFEGKAAALKDRLTEIISKKAQVVESIAAGTENLENNLTELKKQEIAKQSEIAAFNEVLEQLRRLESAVVQEVNSLSSKIIPAYREAWQAAGAALSEELRESVGDKLLMTIAALRISGVGGDFQSMVFRLFYPNGFFMADLLERTNTLRSQYGL